MATPASVVCSLGASSWHCLCCPTTSAGETLDLACRIGQRRQHGVVPSLEALSRSLVESPKRHDGVQVGGRLERGLPGRNVRCRMRFLVVFFRLVQSHRSLADLRHLRVGGCVGCAILQSWLPEFSSSIVTQFGSSVYLLPTIRGRRWCKESLRCSVVVGCVVSRVASCLY
jgi:hypothetical protein